MQDLSVIVTCHNKIDFIPGFLLHAEIILNEGFELVIIDDASTDGSVNLLESFAAKHSQLKFLKFSENQGSAKSRNTGIENASRSFLFFLDIDDTCNIDTLKTVFHDLILHNGDLAIANLRVFPENSLLRMPIDTQATISIPISSIYSEISENMGYSRYIYKRDFAIKSAIRFFPTRIEAEGSHFILDDAFWLILVSASNGIAVVTPPNRIIYNYNRPPSTLLAWERYLLQVTQLPQLSLRFLNEFNTSKSINSKLLQRNMRVWLFKSVKVLPFRYAMKSRLFSVVFLVRLNRELNHDIGILLLLKESFLFLLTSLRNTIRIRSRFESLKGTL